MCSSDTFIPHLGIIKNSMWQVCLSNGKYLKFMGQNVVSFPKVLSATCPFATYNFTVVDLQVIISSVSRTLQIKQGIEMTFALNMIVNAGEI